MRRLLLIPALFAALSFTAPAGASAPFAQQADLTAADVGAGDLIGGFMAISGNTLVLASSTHRNGAASNPGAVYVYERGASGWPHARQTAELTLPSGAGTPSAVAISGNTLAVAASDAPVANHVHQGVVFIFEKPASGWKDAQLTSALTASDGRAEDALGSSIAMSGDTIVASAPLHAVGNNPEQGAAYVFVKPAAGWKSAQENAKLIAAGGVGNDRLGSVAIDADTIVLGSPSHKVGDNAEQGEAYVFVKPSTGWATRAQTAKLAASNGAAGDGLGESVAVSGDTVVAGASGHDGSRGAVDVFVKPADGWATETQAAELTASDGGPNDAFGGSVALSGDKILTGAPFHMVSQTSFGQGYLFVRPATGWANGTETQRVTSADGLFFGGINLLAGNVAVLGAPVTQVGDAKFAGRAYVFGSAPAMTIDAPLDGATFTQGDAVAASYSCAGATGVNIASCTGPVASGGSIDTGAAGPHTFTVDAVDSDGIAATRSVGYDVKAKADPPPPPPPGKAPSITALKQSVKHWRERGKRPLGTTYSFRLDQPARVTLRFARSGKPAGSVALAGRPGVNKVRFRGRISRKKTLPAGRYTLRLSATNAAGKSATSPQLRFAIVRR
jgi:FG-GAP repeat